MRIRPLERGSSKMVRRLLRAGFTMAIEYSFGALTLGGCAGAPWPSNGQLPERVVDQLTACGKKGPTPLESVNYDLTFTVHVTEDDVEARVDDVMLTGSTLHLQEVEACMADALHGMRTPLEALALRRRQAAPEPNVSPEARAMFGQAQVALLLEAGAVLVVGFAVYTVIVHVITDKHHRKPRSHPAQPEVAEPPAPPIPTATTMSTATTAPTALPITTAVPLARRYPNQTCEDNELDRLGREKDNLCDIIYAAKCNVNEKKRKDIPCSAILLSLRQRRACLAARKEVQDKCFGGAPDAGHKQQIDDVQRGVDLCEILKAVNCAKGHPMAGR